MQSFNIPKKLLRIEDLTFILPDDFDGNIQSALRLLASYLDIEFLRDTIDPNIIEPGKKEDDLKKLLTNIEKKVAMNYGIFEMKEDGKYYLKMK